MFRLEDLTVFVRTVEAGNLSAAARALDCSSAVASAALMRLESALGQRLLLRTTRNMRLSPAGERFLPHAIEALRVLEEGQASLKDDGAVLRGQVRISAPSDLGRNQLREWLDEFLAKHPDLEVRLQVGDRLSNLFREPVDIALRYGTVHDESLVAQPLAPDNRRVAVASASYVTRWGSPATPSGLSAHACLLYTVEEKANDRWRFYRGSDEIAVSVRSRRVAEDGDVVRRWALDGQGIAYLSAIDVARDLSAGRLVSLLPDWRGEIVPLYFVCAHRTLLSPTVISLKQMLLERLSTRDVP
jgi:DNA-binding transcriptional LysR family regulator